LAGPKLAASRSISLINDTVESVQRTQIFPKNTKLLKYVKRLRILDSKLKDKIKKITINENN